jgi:hypothetical protein
VPTDDDVFVILSSFQTSGYDIYSAYGVDERMAERFGGTMPPIYGYKTTEKDPIHEDKCKGTHYPRWRKKFAKSLVTGETKDNLEHFRWAHVPSAQYSEWRSNVETIEWLEEKLGADKDVCVFLRRRYEGGKAVRAFDYLTTQGLQNLDASSRDDDEKSEAELLLEAIYKKYPLLTRGGIDSLLNDGDGREDWIQYIRLVDAYGDAVKG